MQARAFILVNGLGYPIVLKPDVGQRGSGVSIIKSERELENYLLNVKFDTLIQEYVPGEEFGIFYYRYPDQQRGHIFAITEKRFPSVRGNGRSTLEDLILNDDRAVCMAGFLLKQHKDRLSMRPGAGEKVELVELGTHCRGAIFLDGGWVRTNELEGAIDRISRAFEGFYFGRFDIRAPDIEDIKGGRNLRVIELNGVTSEATNIYDPKNSLFDAYKILFEQWRIAFEISAHNRARGVKPSSVITLARALIDYAER